MGTVTVLEYQPEWPRQAEALANAIRPRLQGLIHGIEHVGSTSVPGLAAKPVLDIDIIIAPGIAMDRIVEALAPLGYEHRGDLGIATREAFGRPQATVPRDGSGREWPVHHLYACPHDSPERRRHRLLRDHLRAHPADRDAYADLKRRLAKEHPDDMDAYCRGKTQFITGILRLYDPDLAEEAARQNLS